jgi:hypothetical protein
MIDSGAPPQDAAKYDGDHRCFPFQTRRFSSGKSRRISRDDTPLRLLIRRDSSTVGGYSISRWT